MMTQLPVPTDDRQAMVINDIRQYGLHFVHVLEHEDLPGFTYTTGLWYTHGQPEVLIIGLSYDLSRWMLNEISRRISLYGEKFVPGTTYDGLLDGFDVLFVDVPQHHYDDYVPWNTWLYQGHDFPLRQCVWPSTKGDMPWDQGASDWFRAWQPVLGDKDRC